MLNLFRSKYTAVKLHLQRLGDVFCKPRIYIGILLMGLGWLWGDISITAMAETPKEISLAMPNKIELTDMTVVVDYYFDQAQQSYKIYLTHYLQPGRFVYENREGYHMQTTVVDQKSMESLLYATAFSDSQAQKFEHTIFTEEFSEEISLSLANNPALQQNVAEGLNIVLTATYPLCGEYCMMNNLVLPIKLLPTRQATPELLQLQHNIHSISTLNRSDGALNILLILGFAFLGGLLLNLMPCIFPVLSIKILGILKFSHKSSYIRWALLSTAAGIILTLGGLGAILTLLRRTGEMVGWGMYFQNIYLLLFLTVIMTLFAGSFLGLIQLNYAPVTGFLSRHLLTGQHKRQNDMRLRIVIDNFFAGVIIILLSTPCSAPFLGTATSYAIVKGGYYIPLIFLAIGVGLALPYLLFALWPKLLQYLPKSGKWMHKVEYVMGFVVLLTVLWLLSLVYEAAGPWVLFKAIYFMVVLLFHQKIIRLLNFTAPGREIQLSRVLLVVLSGCMMALPYFSVPKHTTQVENWDATQHSFSEERLQRELARKQVVLVTISADWCVTCKLNDKLVFSDQEVQKLLTKYSVVWLKGDLTQRNAAVSAYLNARQRFGIPYSVIYSPKYPQGMVLPDILTKKKFLESLRQHL